jgi:tRNA uridine 5-carbamoylmethylation protein Kti12
MPLLLICGPPGSGKSVRAKELAAYFEEAHKMQICLINEEELKIIKNEGYQG